MAIFRDQFLKKYLVWHDLTKMYEVCEVKIILDTNLFAKIVYTLELSFVRLSTEGCLSRTYGQISQVKVVCSPNLKDLELFFDLFTIRSCKLLQQI